MQLFDYCKCSPGYAPASHSGFTRQRLRLQLHSLWFRRIQCLALRSVLSVFINLRSAECVCSYCGLRVCS